MNKTLLNYFISENALIANCGVFKTQVVFNVGCFRYWSLSILNIIISRDVFCWMFSSAFSFYESRLLRNYIRRKIILKIQNLFLTLPNARKKKKKFHATNAKVCLRDLLKAHLCSKASFQLFLYFLQLLFVRGFLDYLLW